MDRETGRAAHTCSLLTPVMGISCLANAGERGGRPGGVGRGEPRRGRGGKEEREREGWRREGSKGAGGNCCNQLTVES